MKDTGVLDEKTDIVDDYNRLKERTEFVAMCSRLDEIYDATTANQERVDHQINEIGGRFATVEDFLEELTKTYHDEEEAMAAHTLRSG